MRDPIHHCKTGISLTGFQWLPIKLLDHRWNTFHRMVFIENISGCSSLNGFYFVDIWYCVWVPYTTAIFQARAYQYCVCMFLEVPRAVTRPMRLYLYYCWFCWCGCSRIVYETEGDQANKALTKGYLKPCCNCKYFSRGLLTRSLIIMSLYLSSALLYMSEDNSLSAFLTSSFKTACRPSAWFF